MTERVGNIAVAALGGEMVTAQHVKFLCAIARGENPAIVPMNPSGDRTVGFAVLMFAFGAPPQPATWISNADRGDMIRAVEEWLERAKARQ